MAANYWVSSQLLHWQMPRSKIEEKRRALDAQDEKATQDFPLPNYRQLSIYFNTQLIRLGRRMQTRQQALATAQLYVRRFYTKVPIRDTNPYLVMATCLYLALKMEECPQHIRIVVSEARTCWPDIMPTDPTKLAECEFYVISEMNSYLIVHHPYRTLQDLTPELKLTTEENSIAWQVINDSCITDLPVIYPPHIIAVTAIFLAVVMKPTTTQGGASSSAASAVAAATAKASGSGSNGGTVTAIGEGSQAKANNLIDWIAESKLDMEAIVDCIQEIITLYEVWEKFTAAAEKTCKEQLCRMVKQRGT